MVHRLRAAQGLAVGNPAVLGEPFRPVALRPHFSVSLPLLGPATCDAMPRRRRVGCYTRRIYVNEANVTPTALNGDKRVIQRTVRSAVCGCRQRFARDSDQIGT